MKFEYDNRIKSLVEEINYYEDLDSKQNIAIKKFEEKLSKQKDE